MATPNYGYEKRQRELAKKKKKEDKLRAKASDRRPDQGGYAPQSDSQHPQSQQPQGQHPDGATAQPPKPDRPASSPQGQTGQ